jgi:hypothetical protein
VIFLRTRGQTADPRTMGYGALLSAFIFALGLVALQNEAIAQVIPVSSSSALQQAMIGKARPPRPRCVSSGFNYPTTPKQRFTKMLCRAARIPQLSGARTADLVWAAFSKPAFPKVTRNCPGRLIA